MISASVPLLFDSDGKTLHPGKELGRGGEAVVYTVSGSDHHAIKLYHHIDDTRIDKLKVMISHIPEDPARAAGHVAIAWPETLIQNSDNEVVGFSMPRFDTKQALPLHQLYHPGTRRQRARGMSWRYLVRIARNLSAIASALHGKGYVIGDLNESNILVTPRALVTLIDLDSIQVRSGTRVYRCGVGKAEYTPPELQNRSFHEVIRAPRHDRYGLAVLLFLLLMEGVHPFTGVYRGEGEPPTLEANIAARKSPYFGNRLLNPVPTAPPLTLLPKSIRRLMRRALTGPAWHRPSAHAWQQALEQFEGRLIRCELVTTHVYGDHLRDCPWCARKASLGVDAYPSDADLDRSSSSRSPTQVQRPLPSAPPPLATFKGSFGRLFFHLPLITLLIGTTFLGISYLLSRQLGSDAGSWVVARPASLAIKVFGLFAPTTLGLIWLFRCSKSSPGFFSSVVWAERLVRALLAASGLALAMSALIGRLTGSGSVFSGDWLYLPSFWIVSFVLFLRTLRPSD
ncbi:MAG: hypothetical protein JSV66_08730 [Trueperaceae bacterium]|nr:MAG: hypothetical protein JSV66_08730 [Trueperaceae bacterium]